MRRILSIDGGGIRGVFPASFLSWIEDAIEDNIANYFDLVVGTSTGGIIALGLGSGFPARDIVRFYEDFGPEIFKGNRLMRGIRQLGYSKYSDKPLRCALESTFGQRRLGDSRSRLVIPSLNLETGQVYIYKTAHNTRLENDYKERVVDVALATAAAPTFFPTYRSDAGTPLIDGGVWANNPTGLAVVEAIGVLDWPRESLRVLSLGCTTEPLGVNRGRLSGLGVTYWASKIVDVFMTAQSYSSLGTAYVLINHQDVMRVSPYVQRGRFGLDAVSEISALKGLGRSEARSSLPDVRRLFIEGGHAEAFEPHFRL